MLAYWTHKCAMPYISLRASSRQDLQEWTVCNEVISNLGCCSFFCFQHIDRDLERNDTGYLDVVLRCDARDSWRGQRCCSPSLFGPVAGRQGIDGPSLTYAASEQTRAPRWALNCWCCVAGRLLRVDGPGAALGIFLSLPLTKQSSLCKTLGPWRDQANSLQGLSKPAVINVLLSCGLFCAGLKPPTAVTGGVEGISPHMQMCRAR